MAKTVIVSGATGQAGSTLIKKLLTDPEIKKIYGLKRKSSSFNTERLDDVYQDKNIDSRLELVYADLQDYASLSTIIADVKPDHFYNLGAQSNVGTSFKLAVSTADITGMGVARVLEALRIHSPKTRVLQASSSEMFGKTPAPQNEESPMYPCSPYGCSKLFAYSLCRNYRDSYGMFITNMIAYNYEGTARPEFFLTRKTTRAATRIAKGLQDYLYLGDLSTKRDWNSVHDVVDSMLLMINADKPDDYCVASGTMTSVQDFVEIVFSKLGMDWKKYVKIDPAQIRPCEVQELCGDSSKLRKNLGWEPKYNLNMIIDEMIAYDMKLAEQEMLLKNHNA